MSANDTQVGGSHYAQGGALQHWDFIEAHDLGYIEGCATKYVIRWRGKHVYPELFRKIAELFGIRLASPEEDLLKTRHYIEKLRELHLEGSRYPRGAAHPNDIHAFLTANKVGTLEGVVVQLLCSRWNVSDLDAAIDAVDNLISESRRVG